jgi:hypothetical protein
MNSTFRSDLHRVGCGYSVRWVLHSGHRIECAWHPAHPNRKDGRRILKTGVYQQVRHQFFCDMARELGVNIMCVDA